MQESLTPKSVNMLDMQKQVIKEMLDEKRKRGEIKSDSEYQAEWNTMLSKLEGHSIFTTVRRQEEMTDAASFNETFQEVEADLRSIFLQINQNDETIMKHRRLNQSMLNNMKLRMKKIENSLTRYERLSDVQSSEQMHFETFIDNNQFEPNYTYYTERNGQTAPADYHAKWDVEQEALKLPTILSDNGLIGAGGIRLGTIHIRKQLGTSASDLKNPLHSMEKAIDTDPESYWFEQVTMDAPIQVEMGSEYYNIKHGAMVELEIRFDYLTALNEIALNVFGEFPFDIVGVKYFETDNENEIGKELIYPDSPVSELQSKSVEEYTVFQFPDISAKRLRLVFNQRHYIKRDFIASERHQRNLKLWIASREGRASVDIQDYDIDKVIETLQKDSAHPITKYEYQYGLYNLSVRRNEYQPTGIYVSKEIHLNGNAKTIQLDTKEHHPEHLAPLQLTDIEYDVYDGKKWYPILPVTQGKVYSELLFPELIQGHHQAATRFTVDGEWVIRKNGVDVAGRAVLTNDNRTVLFAEYDPSAYYTIEYRPTSDAWMIDFLKEYEQDGEIKPNILTEEFKGTNSKGRISLQQYPFVDKTKLHAQSDDYNPSYLENEYIPIKVRLIDSNGYRIEQPMNQHEKDLQVRNMTDYFTSSSDLLETYDDHEHFYQYEVVGNEIQFNTVIPESTRIVVEYPYLVSHVRVKAILRRNIPGFHGLTPILEDYVVHFQTLK